MPLSAREGHVSIIYSAWSIAAVRGAASDSPDVSRCMTKSIIGLDHPYLSYVSRWVGLSFQEELMQGVKALVEGCQVHHPIAGCLFSGEYQTTRRCLTGSQKPTRCILHQSTLREHRISLQRIECLNKRRASTAPMDIHDLHRIHASSSLCPASSGRDTANTAHQVPLDACAIDEPISSQLAPPS